MDYLREQIMAGGVIMYENLCGDCGKHFITFEGGRFICPHVNCQSENTCLNEKTYFGSEAMNKEEVTEMEAKLLSDKPRHE